MFEPPCRMGDRSFDAIIAKTTPGSKSSYSNKQQRDSATLIWFCSLYARMSAILWQLFLLVSLK